MDNTSGLGKSATVPAEIDRWNWGAFLLSWIWGIGNNTFIALLMFVPFVNLVMWFVLGVKGSAWAWQNKRWDSVDHFKSVQRKWAIWGSGLVIATFLGTFLIVYAAVATLKHSEAFQLAVAKLEANPQVAESIGQPITTGIPLGEFQIYNNTGSANFSFRISGPKGKGKVHCEATKERGRWKIDDLRVNPVDGAEPIVIAS
jgi:Cytochrome oxidase complex assembly protein 1